MSAGRSIALDAPAKLNLGLEIIGKRADGYHDLATIFQAVEPVDRLDLAPSGDLSLAVSDPALAGPGNLAHRALGLLRERYGVKEGAAARLDKAIPAAAGMGGASSDAAAALLGGRDLWRLPASDDDLAELGATLGSDVPFFIRGGTAFASGRGEVLTPLPAVKAWFVIVSPPIHIERKTPTLYGALRPGDFSDGSAVREQAARIARGETLDPALLVNAFTRPLLALRPELGELRDAMARAGAPPCLSGAGPTHYAVFGDPGAAEVAATRIRTAIGPAAMIRISPALPPRTTGGSCNTLTV